MARMENCYDSEEEEVVAKPLAHCASVPADVDSCQIHMLTGSRCAHCDYESNDNDYGSNDDDGDDVVAKPLARHATVAVVD